MLNHFNSKKYIQGLGTISYLFHFVSPLPFSAVSVASVPSVFLVALRSGERLCERAGARAPVPECILTKLEGCCFPG
jgi:hypothetical protein